MATLLVRVRSATIQAGQLRAEIELEHVSGRQLATTISVDNSLVTSVNFVTGLKNQLITYAQNQFGVTLSPTEILVFGAPQ